MNKKICKEAIYHIAYDKYAYQDILDNKLMLIIRTKKNDVDLIKVRFGDPFKFIFKNKNKGVTQLGGGSNAKWVEDGQEIMKKSFSDDFFDYYQAKIFHPSKRIRYAFEIQKNKEVILYGEHGIIDGNNYSIDKIGFTWGYLNKGNVIEIPTWVYKTVWYQIFPERFSNGNQENDPDNVLDWGSKDPSTNNFFGGDLRGVINNLDHIVKLGCNGIYFTPIFHANTNHKYDTIDYLKIDPYFGSEETFRELIVEAHKKGIKIMIDGVFNHCGHLFPQWLDVLKKKETSEYYDWFFINNSQNLKPAKLYEKNYFRDVEQVYETFGYTPIMPRLNWSNLELKKYFEKAVSKWTSFGIDAWRLDVANEPPLNFWREFRQWVKKINPDNFIIGEIWYDANLYLKGDTFDSVMNYRLRDLIIRTINENWNKNQFGEFFSKYSLLYTDTIKRAMFNLLSSHDTPRLLTIFKNDVKKYLFAYKLMFVMLGNPCIYYGDEVGMDGEHDPMCRKCMEWDKNKWNKEIYQTFKKLIHIRKSNPELYLGNYEIVENENENIFIIKYSFEDNSVFAFINLGDKVESINLKNKIIYNLFDETLLFDFISVPQKDVVITKIYENKSNQKLSKEWWKQAVVYQVYPISFKDSNGDGRGDLVGLIQKLPYLADLGINVIWLNPIFASPMKDNGYDVSDYFKINPIYGDLKTAEKLIKIANSLGIKIILDIIPNHTSIEHKWFKEALKNNSEFRKYYYITDKPNFERESVFGGTAWKKIDNKNYYLHSFAPEQADLNWNNPKITQEFAKILDFWIEKGAYGFRFDVIDDIAKDVNEKNLIDYKKLHTLVQKWKASSKWKSKNLLTVGESWNSTVENAKLYSNPKQNELSMVFGFEHLCTNWEKDKWNLSKFKLEKFKEVIQKWQNGLYNEGWNSLFMNNHDFPRLVSIFGSKRFWKESAKAIALTIHMLQGTPFIYQGEEIGMTNCQFDSLSEHRDVELFQMFDAFKNKNPKWTEIDHLNYVKKFNRDNARTPMQWNDAKNAGFCEDHIQPWIKINQNYKLINVTFQQAQPFSILNWYKAIIKLRRDSNISEIIEKGDFKLIEPKNKKLFMYERSYKNQKIILLANWSYSETDINLDAKYYGKVVIDNYDEFNFNILKPWQAVLLIKENK